MRLIAPAIIALGATAVAAACSTTADQPGRSAAAQEELNKELAGRTAGPPLNCIPRYNSTDMKIVDDWTILFKDGRMTYLQTPRGGCSGIGIGRTTLVTRLWGTSQLCSGDISHLVDLHTGMQTGACVFGPFVPYSRTN